MKLLCLIGFHCWSMWFPDINAKWERRVCMRCGHEQERRAVKVKYREVK